MRYFRYSFIVVVVGFLFCRIEIKETTINKLKSQLKQQNNTIDSLFCRIDTLQRENQIWDFNLPNNKTHLLSAMMFIESSYNDSAYNSYEDAVGCLQIRKCMVDDINRILRRQNLDLEFTYNDRWSRSKSIRMFDVYCDYYRLITAEQIARCWNGGPQGMKNKRTAGYWKKVKNQLNS
tara:strand:- start:287 stop:820 length:534 start_codon:yes stop_codon:yes gene_type:complete